MSFTIQPLLSKGIHLIYEILPPDIKKKCLLQRNYPSSFIGNSWISRNGWESCLWQENIPPKSSQQEQRGPLAKKGFEKIGIPSTFPWKCQDLKFFYLSLRHSNFGKWVIFLWELPHTREEESAFRLALCFDFPAIPEVASPSGS